MGDIASPCPQVTVVDEHNQALCLMPLEAARAQGLFYRSVALLLTSGPGKHIFRWETRKIISLPVYASLPGQEDAADFCAARLLALGAKIPAVLHRIKIISPCPETDFSFCTLYKGCMAAPFPQGAERPLFSGGLGDLAALREFGCEVAPVCAHVYGLDAASA